MRTIRANKVTKENFARFGEYYNMREEGNTNGDVWKCFMTKETIIPETSHLGYVVCEGGASFLTDSMERHMYSEEILFCGDQPTVLTVADSDPHGELREEDVASFILCAGDVVKLKKGIYHDANHAVDMPSYYYFIAGGSGQDDPSETYWHPVVPEPVKTIVW